MPRFLDYETDTGLTIRIKVNYQDPDVSESERLTKGGWEESELDKVPCYPFVSSKSLKPRRIKYNFNDKFVWIYVKTLSEYQSLQKDGIDKAKAYKGEQTTNCLVLDV